MKYFLFVLGFFCSLSLVSAQTPVPCGQSLQLQGVPNSFTPTGMCNVNSSDFGPFSHPGNSVFTNVPSNFQPPINRTTQSVGSYEMTCPNSTGGVTSNTVDVTFQACAPGNGTSTPQYKCSSNQCAVCTQADVNAGTCTGGSSCTAVGQSCGTGGPGTGICGDSIVQNPNSNGISEQCDLGSQNGQTGSTCSATCQTITPSTQYKCSSNQCAMCTQADINAGTCTGGSSCTAAGQACGAGPSCGNGIVEAGEQCDQSGCTGSDICGAAATANACQCYTPLSPTCSIYTDNGVYQYPVGATPSAKVRFLNMPGISSIWNALFTSPNPDASGISVNGNDVVEDILLSPIQLGLNTITVQRTNVVGGVCSASFTGVNQTSIDIGWTAAYTPKSKTVNAPANETLYVNTGGRTDCSISGALNVNPVTFSSYAVNNVPVGNYGYTLSCPNVAPVQATLVVDTAASPQYKCVNNSCAACDPNGDKTGCTSLAACQASCGAAPQDNGECATSPIVTNPSRVVAGKTFSVPFSFRNTGTTNWSNGAGYKPMTTATSRISWSQAFLSQNILISGTIAGVPVNGVTAHSAIFTAPSTPGSYNLGFVMGKNGTSFGTSCLVNGTGIVQVVAPECSDGIDNTDPEDTLVDALDPACIRGGTYDPNWDNETDPTPGVVLKINANPQLVRSGGGSVVTYEVNGCEDVSAKDPTLLAWQVTRDGNLVTGANGLGTSNGQQRIDVSNIQTKTTFTLSCGGTTRSATISVIKINEF